MRRDELGEHVRLEPLEVPRYLGIIETDVALLRQLVRQGLAGHQEELVDPDVRRQPALTDGRRIERLDAAGEEAVDKRLGEPTLQRRAGARQRQRQAREEREPHTTIRLSQAIQCIDDEDRLADAHRNSEPEIVAYAIDDGLRAAIRFAEDNAPRDVCLFREHRRNPYSSTSVRNCIGRRAPLR